MSAMSAYDEYEMDSEDLEEEYEEEEVHQPTRDEVEYLGLRERLKEKFRKKMKKESGSANSSSLGKMTLSRNDNYGTFFGPSRRSISERVIQESKSLLENPEIATRVFKSSSAKTKSSASTHVGSKPRTNIAAPKVTNVVKKKAEILKNTRDYSFLLSDDAELPAPVKDRRPQNVSAPNSAPAKDRRPRNESSPNIDARSAKMQQRIREPQRESGRRVSDGRDIRREPLGESGRKVPDGRDIRRFKPSGNQAQGKPRPTSMDSEKQLSRGKGIGPGRSSMDFVPSKIPQKKVCAPDARRSVPQVHKPAPTKLQASVSKHPVIQKRGTEESYRAQVLQKQPTLSSKTQITRAPPGNLSRMEDGRAKRKPVRRDEPRRRYEDEDDTEDAFKMMRQITGYNPNKFQDDEEDLSDMEANFHDILREERHSLILAQKEDEIALREIEEEERRERMRKEKKRKMR